MILLDTLVLPETLVWTDRHAWQPAAQSVKRTLAGGIIVFHRHLVGGRPITLTGGQTWGWMQTETMEAVASMAQEPGHVYSLSIYGEAFRVLFRHEEPPAFDAVPLRPQNPQPGPAT
jgi:hypothetical protein